VGLDSAGYTMISSHMPRSPLKDFIDLYKREDSQVCLFTGAGASFTFAKAYRVDGGWWGVLHEIYRRIQHRYAPEKSDQEIRSDFEALKATPLTEWDMAEELNRMVAECGRRTGGPAEFTDFVRDAVIPFQSRARKDKSKNLPNAYLMRAHTLNALIAFCSKLSALGRHPCLDLNEKVRAVLTLNYDWFIEGGASQKYRRKMIFKPVARDRFQEEEGKLSVFHIHGYFPFHRDRDPDCEIILTKSDYERAYGDGSQASLRHRILDRFLGTYSTLFVGLSFKDEHFLSYLERSARSREETPRHFAFLIKDEITDDLRKRLADANVSIIRFEQYRQLPDLLRDVYVSTLPVRKRVKDRSSKTGNGYKNLTPNGYWKRLLQIKEYQPARYGEAG
jgi:hypothetical protein